MLESRNSRRGYDTACDMWSVGVLMYILLSRSQPFADEGEEDGPHASVFEKIREGVGTAHFAEPVWQAVSPAAKHFICQLLVVDPRKRLAVDAALHHPWMRGETGSEADVAALLRGRDEIEDSDEEGDAHFGAGIGGGPLLRYRTAAAGFQQSSLAKRQRTAVPPRANLPIAHQVPHHASPPFAPPPSPAASVGGAARLLHPAHVPPLPTHWPPSSGGVLRVRPPNAVSAAAQQQPAAPLSAHEGAPKPRAILAGAGAARRPVGPLAITRAGPSK